MNNRKVTDEDAMVTTKKTEEIVTFNNLLCS